MEIWRKIEEIENVEVSSMGRFRSTDYCIKYERNGKVFNRLVKGHIIKQSEDDNGYLKIVLCRNKVYKGFVAHRLVAKYFLKDFDEKLEVDHINDNRKDNRVENLRMVTRIENVRKPTTLERVRKYLKNMSTEEKKRRAEKAKKTMALNGIKNGAKKKKIIKWNDNSIELVEDIEYLMDNFNRVCISLACNNKYLGGNYYKGFYWKFA